MKYDIVLFDMDGVMTKELFYWKAAVLTVWESLYQEDPKQMAPRTEEILKTVSCDMETIQYIKRAGVNTNYDLAYVVTALARQFIKEENPFECVKDWLKNQKRTAAELYDYCYQLWGEDWRYLGKVWHQLQDIFQSWYLGDGGDKTGLIHQEVPMFPIPQIQELLTALNRAGVACGIGTGRPRPEIEPHLKRWGWWDLFDHQRIVTQTEVFAAQQALEQEGISVSLSKPHFYMFGKGVAGLECPDKAVINREFDQQAVKKTLVVGDAGADIYAAKALGADFAAVLTGVNGKAERGFFETLNSNYIFDDVFGLLTLL